MLKANRYHEALEELTAVEVLSILTNQELEKNLYGEDSVKLAKTYKIIGTLHIITENLEEAKTYLIQAYKIFEAKGMDKLVKEILNKLKLVNINKKGIEGDETGLSPEKRGTSSKGKKGKKASKY